MRTLRTILIAFPGVLLPLMATAEPPDALPAPLLRGAFEQVAAPPPGETATGDRSAGEQPAAAVSDYYRGLAAFALQDYAAAVATLATVAERQGDQPVGLRAAVVTTIALSRNGDAENACRYAGIVLPLTDRLSPIWRVWVEEAQRASACE